MFSFVRLIFIFIFLFAWSLSAQATGLALDPSHAQDTYVTGNAAVDSGRIAVYDTSYPARTKLGEGKVDKNMRFAFSVHPPLQEGHTLVVEDELKKLSPAITILPLHAGPIPTR